MMSIVFSVMGLVLLGVPMLLGLSRLFESKWWAIAFSTLVTPFLMLGVPLLIGKIYLAFDHSPVGRGCSGGECGGEAYAAGLWPLLIPIFMVPSFVVSLVLILLIRRFRV